MVPANAGATQAGRPLPPPLAAMAQLLHLHPLQHPHLHLPQLQHRHPPPHLHPRLQHPLLQHLLPAR